PDWNTPRPISDLRGARKKNLLPRLSNFPLIEHSGRVRKSREDPPSAVACPAVVQQSLGRKLKLPGRISPARFLQAKMARCLTLVLVSAVVSANRASDFKKHPSLLMVTIREVAKESGFSPATVSIVLNNAPLARYIPETTKNRIVRAAKKLGYRPNVFARTLRNQRTHTVGVMVFDMTDPYCIPILRGIENALYEASFLPILTDVHNERSRFERYLEMLLDRRVEALIIVANWLFVEIDVLGDLEKANIPTAMIGRELQAGSISSVIVDNELGANAAIEHLFALGHRQIAFIRGPKRITDTAPRWKGVRNFAKAHDLEIDPALVLDLPESSDPIASFDAGYKLTENLMRQKRPFTALMAFDDMTALGAVRALS